MVWLKQKLLSSGSISYPAPDCSSGSTFESVSNILSYCAVCSLGAGKSSCPLQFTWKQTNKRKTYIPTPLVCWVSLTNIDNNEICHLFKLSNDTREVVPKVYVKRRSAATTKVDYKGTFSSGEIQESARLAIHCNQIAVWSARTKTSRLVVVAGKYPHDSCKHFLASVFIPKILVRHEKMSFLVPLDLFLSEGKGRSDSQNARDNRAFHNGNAKTNTLTQLC